MVVSGEIRGFEEAELKGLSGDWKIRLARQRDRAFTNYGSWARAKTSFGVSDFCGLYSPVLAETVIVAGEEQGLTLGFFSPLRHSVKSKKKLISLRSGKLETQQHVSGHSWKVIWLPLSLKKNRGPSPALWRNIWLCLHPGLQGTAVPDIYSLPCSFFLLQTWPSIWLLDGSI